jgi:RNA polymerase sigma-70 factor (ECF subfamily)
MQNVWIDECRRRRVRGEVTPVEETAFSIDGELELYHRLLLIQIGKGIAYLPRLQRRVLHHVVFEGLTYRETAQEMQTSIGTVMSRLSRARRHLEKAMG